MPQTTQDKRGVWTFQGGKWGASDSSDIFYFNDDFSSGDFSKTSSGFSWGNKANCEIIEGFSVNGEVGNCVKFNFGIPAESVSELRFDLGDEFPEIWMQFYLYYPTGEEELDLGPKAELTGNNNKFFRIFADSPNGSGNGGDPRFGASYYSTTPSGDSRIGAQAGKYQDGSTSLVPSSENPAYCDLVNDNTRGVWQKIKIRVKGATSSTSQDGQFQLWLNDVEQWNITNINAYSDLYSGVRKGYLMGAQDAPWLNAGTNIYLSNFTVSSQDIQL